MLARHSILGTSLSDLNKVNKAPLAFIETALDGFLGKLRKFFVLHDKIVQVVSQVVCTCCPTMAIKDAKETDLGPIHTQILLAFWLEDVEDDRDSVLIVVPNYALISVRSVRFYNATLLLRSLRRLVIFQKEGLWVQYRWVLAEK